MKESYLSQIRRKTLMKLVAFTRMVGSNADERIILDAKCSIRYFLKNKRKKLMKEAKFIVCQAIMQIAKLHDFATKSQVFLKNGSFIFFINFLTSNIVLIIQKKWKFLQRKKIFFKLLVKNLWKEKFNEFYLDLKGIYSKNPNKIGGSKRFYQNFLSFKS